MKIIIGYVSAADPFHDRKAWSGTIYKLREAIEMAGFEVRWIPYIPNYGRSSWHSRINDYCWRVRREITHKKALGDVHSISNVRRYAQSIDIKKVNECDYLFFPGRAQIGLFLKTEVPIIFLADSTIHVMIDYYYYNIDKRAVRIAREMEEKTCQKSLINIRSSQWAIDSVINDCHVDKTKCHLLEFGANIDEKDIEPVPVYNGGALNILFSGVDWKRKGGDVAVETVRLLRVKGIDAKLTIVGIKELPSEYSDCDFIDFRGFLDKNTPESYKEYIQLYKQSHLSLLPTKAECSAIVFSEAAGFGIPCYTYATGGTTNYVINGCNGFAFPMGSTPSVFADKIYDDLKNGRFKRYHDNALELYKNKLSWNAWANRFKEILTDNHARM